MVAKFVLLNKHKENSPIEMKKKIFFVKSRLSV